MKYIELLAPVGDFECLKAAVQNGANAVYLGASNFSARASAKNFTIEELEKAIHYANLRNVQVHLALNTLLKNEELPEALALAQKAYELGVSAIIVQDYGLASLLLKQLPDLPIHASTQMSIHNLEGVQELESLGFSRVVLSRELSLQELEFICSNTSIELETFIHGALCISYSGQCLLSSMIGGRSGNRGKCAQACRLPYELIQQSSSKEQVLKKGYLLSPRDLCGLDFIPSLIDMGIHSLKIEGRMKTPEYVAIVTRIYRKYIDLALSSKKYIIEEQDRKELLQVFNRGGFSSGHLNPEPNLDLIYSEKPNNMGLYIGNVANYNATKGHITVNLNDTIGLGDTICFEKEDTKYHVSELMIQHKNIPDATAGQMVKIGRMKGNIHAGDKIYKLESKVLSTFATSTYQREVYKTNLTATITMKENLPIQIDVLGPYHTHTTMFSETIPMKAIKNPITPERIRTQLSKTGDTPFCFEKIDILLDPNLYLNISDLNDLRRRVLSEIEKQILQHFQHPIKKNISVPTYKEILRPQSKKSISLLLNTLDINTNYSNLESVEHIYIPLKYFSKIEYSNILKNLSNTFSMYIYMPNIIKANYRNLFGTLINSALEEYHIKGFVLSNMGTIKMLEKYKGKYEFIGNYTLNVLNSSTMHAYQSLGIHTITLSPELNKTDIEALGSITSLKKECIVYGNTPVMTCGYCFLGNSNKCYPNCTSQCMNEESSYFLKDRLGLQFKLVPDNIQTVTTIYNSKITSLSSTNLPIDSVRIDILDENLLEINAIIKAVKEEKRIQGKDYTNGNFNRVI